MSLFGYRLRQEAAKLFKERDTLVIELADSTLEEIHTKSAFYKKKRDDLSIVLKGCRPWINKEVEAEILIKKPRFENEQFRLVEYEFEDRTFLYKSEIEEYIAYIDMKLKECEKFSTDIPATSGIA